MCHQSPKHYIEIWHERPFSLHWAKMRNKRKNQHAKDGTKRGQKRPRPAGLESWAGRPSPFRSPIGLGFLQHEVCVNPNLCFTKTTDQNCLYIYPEAAVKERGITERFRREHPETSFRDPFELDTRERRHRRPHRPSAPLQVGGQQGIHPLPEISSP